MAGIWETIPHRATMGPNHRRSVVPREPAPIAEWNSPPHRDLPQLSVCSTSVSQSRGFSRRLVLDPHDMAIAFESWLTSKHREPQDTYPAKTYTKRLRLWTVALECYIIYHIACCLVGLFATLLGTACLDKGGNHEGKNPAEGKPTASGLCCVIVVNCRSAPRRRQGSD